MLGLDKRKIDKMEIKKKDRKLVYSISKRRRLFLFFWRNGFLPKIWPNFHYFRVASFTQNSCTKSVRIMQKLKIDNAEVLSDNSIEPESFWSMNFDARSIPKVSLFFSSSLPCGLDNGSLIAKKSYLPLSLAPNIPCSCWLFAVSSNF